MLKRPSPLNVPELEGTVAGETLRGTAWPNPGSEGTIGLRLGPLFLGPSNTELYCGREKASVLYGDVLPPLFVIFALLVLES